MLSPDSRARVGLEWLLRLVGIAMLGLLFLRALLPEPTIAGTAHATSANLSRALVQWTTSRPHAVSITLDSVPAAAQREWLAALARSGTRVTWIGSNIAPTAVTLTSAVDPAGGASMTLAAPSGSSVVLRDRLGAFDTVTSGRDGIRVTLPGAPGVVSASAAGSTASAAPIDSVMLKRVLVEGSAGWEMKFTVAALEERGWQVDALTHVAPGVDVREGTPSRPDTARYSAVIAIDTSARLIANGASAFVRDGGGLITLHDAAMVGPAPEGSTPAVLERRGDGDVRAYRAGNGRVLRIGYRDVWRRRFTEDDTVPDPPAAHREWLAMVVASAAYAPVVDRPHSPAADPAPLASLVDALGPQSRVQSVTSSSRRAAVPTYALFALLMASLLAEFASRRLRGAS